MRRTHLRAVPAPAPPWWEAPELLALAELRRALVGGAVPCEPAQTQEDDARHALFWALYEVEHVLHAYATLVEAGEPVRLRTGIYKHHERRVDFNLRIVEEPEVTVLVQSPRGVP